MIKHFITVAAFAILGFGVSAYAAEAITEDAARAVALAKEPGEILKAVITKTTTATVYDFTIRNTQGTIVDVEVDGHGAITGHEIVKIDAYEDLPDPTVLAGDAKAVAIKHVQEKLPERKKPTVLGAQYTVHAGKPVYKVDLKNGFDSVIVYVDAQTGQVLPY